MFQCSTVFYHLPAKHFLGRSSGGTRCTNTSKNFLAGNMQKTVEQVEHAYFPLSLLLLIIIIYNKINNLSLKHPPKILFHAFHKPIFSSEHVEQSFTPCLNSYLSAPRYAKKSPRTLVVFLVMCYNVIVVTEYFNTRTYLSFHAVRESLFNNLLRSASTEPCRRRRAS